MLDENTTSNTFNSFVEKQENEEKKKKKFLDASEQRAAVIQINGNDLATG